MANTRSTMKTALSLLVMLVFLLVLGAETKAMAATGYVNDPYLTVRVKTKTGKKLTLRYKQKVKVFGKLKRATSQYFKIKAKGKICWLYVKAGRKPFGKYGINYKKYTKKANSEIQQKIVNRAVNVLRNKKSKYSKKNKIVKKTAYFDCSGFMAYSINGVMQNYIKGYRLTTTIPKLQSLGWVYTDKGGRWTAKTICKGTPNFSKLKPGDVLFFKEKGRTRVNHVGIYLGNKEFIHSTRQTNGLSIMPLRKQYKKAFVVARRLAPINKPKPINKMRKLASNAYKVYKDIRFKNVKASLAGVEKVKLLYVMPTIFDAKYNTCFVQYGDTVKQRGFLQSNKLK